MLTVSQVLDQLRSDDSFMRNVTEWHVEPPKPAVYADFPASVPALLKESLNKRGLLIDSYSFVGILATDMDVEVSVQAGHSGNSDLK